MGDTSGLDRANIDPEIFSKPTSPQNLPSAVDFEMQGLDNLQDRSLPGTQTQVHHEIEASASSDRTVRYTDAQPRNGLLEQANSTRA